MYEVILYMDGDITHYVKTDDSGLTGFINDVDDDTGVDFIEVHCFDEDCMMVINRKKLNAYSYKQVAE